MTDIIKILPDNVANQIAAGEVIQRPGSAVKELLENSIDAGADDIQLIIKDAGKTLIQVVDNGCGMSETDARLCFERHATSKINETKDLYNIKTYGFRGEALASIAAVAQVEMKTKRANDEIGTLVIIEGSEVKEHTPCSTPTGTSISVKNLFFNVPARRNFLKSDATETSYIIEEFYRVALVYPEISFSFYNNGKLILHLEKSKLRQRINNIFGSNYGEKLLPVHEQTSIVEIHGYIGKPEFARKTRGEQYFFVNKRFFKHPYLHHALEKAYSELIPENTYPSYFIYFTMPPENIDINIHPAKIEVKFQDEKTIYSILKAAIRKSFGQHNIIPSIDFESDRAFDIIIDPKRPIKVPGITINPNYSPFQEEKKQTHKPESSGTQQRNLQNWEKLYDPLKTLHQQEKTEALFTEKNLQNTSNQFFLLSNKYIITPVKSGLMFIDIRNAYERIFYERLLSQKKKNIHTGQRLLYPQTIDIQVADTDMFHELLKELNILGFEIEPFGKNTFVVNAVPEGYEYEQITEQIEQLLADYKKDFLEPQPEKSNTVVRTLAKHMAAKAKKNLGETEMQSLTAELLSCAMPDTSPSGKKVLFIMPYEDIEKKFK